MGHRSQFRCEGCACEATVSGGPDVGMAAATQTISCAKCKQLFDVVTSEAPWDPQAARLPLRCPRSRTAKHQVTPWAEGDPCPCCGGSMSNTGLVVMWD
jgi:hypothetical protein